MTTILSRFYGKSIFDRIIVYLFLSEFLVKIIFELFLGQWSFIQSQNKQWFFFSFIALDYIVSVRRVIDIRFPLNISTGFALILVVMSMQALAVGVMQDNRAFTIFNDAVPMLIMAVNILRMHSSAEPRTEPDFDFILKTCLLLGSGTALAGWVGQSIGNPTQPSMGNNVIFLPLIAAAIYRKEPVPYWMIVVAFILLMLSLDDLNRTNLSFMAFVAMAFFVMRTIQNPARGLMIIALLIPMVCIPAYLLPQDSKTYIRIAGLANMDLSRRTGSVGERQAEQEAVARKLNQLGVESELLGMGFGGVYSVRFTHQVIDDYGHAHFGWVWFNMRFGMVGYIYLAVMMFSLGVIAYRNVTLYTANGLFVGFLALISIIYVFTYVNAIFMQCGLAFMYLRKSSASRESVPGDIRRMAVRQMA